MDDNLFFIRQAQPVFADEGDGEGLAVHGFFSTWPVHELVLCLWEQQQNILCSAARHRFVNFLAK